MTEPVEIPSKIDGIDILFGILPYGIALFLTITWGRLFIRAIHGEQAKVSTGLSVMSGLGIASWSFMSGTRARENIALRGSVIDLREALRETAADEATRDQRSAARDARMFKLTVAMAVLAGMTLLAAIATLIAK